MLRLPVFLLTAGISFGQSLHPGAGKQSLTADAIMTRVALNQDQDEEMRKQYVCKQHIHIITLKPGGKVMREETTQYDIVPTAMGAQKQLKLLTGRYRHKGKYEDFEGEPVPVADSRDADYMREVRMCLTGDESRCEFAPSYFQ
jgi:hypothetical protein